MPALGLMLGLARLPSTLGGGAALSNDTSLSLFEIDGVNVLPNVGGSINKSNATAGVDIAATPTHPGATRTINGDPGANPRPMLIEVGDQDATVVVTAEDGVTQQTYVVTVHKLTAGVTEVTTFDFTGLTGVDFVTFGTGKSLLFSDRADPGSRYCLWFNTGTEQSPSVIGGVTNYVIVYCGSLDPPDVLASALQGLIGGSVVGNVVTKTQGSIGPVAHAADVDSGVTITVTQQGADPL